MLEEAAQQLAQLAKQPLRAYSTYDFGRERDTSARSIVVPTDVAEDLLNTFRNELSPGVIAFIGTTRWLGDEQHDAASELVVANGASQFDSLLVARSDAINYGMETEDLVKKLTEYDQMHGISIFHAETDTIEFQLLRIPDQLTAFCEDLYTFCPDIVDQNCETVEALAQEIAANEGKVFLWWD